MRILLDTDVLLDVALGRADFGPASGKVLEWCQVTPRAAVLAWHTVANVYYLLCGAGGDVAARRFISDLVRFTEVIGGTNDSIRRALALSMSDFEDAMQVTVAMDADAELIVTRNVRHYRQSPLAVCTPRDFLTHITAS